MLEYESGVENKKLVVVPFAYFDLFKPISPYRLLHSFNP
jgi:hypothetical protein